MFFSSGYLLYCFLKSLTDLREVSSLLSLGIFFFFAGKFIFNSKKIILWPYSHQHFWILSLDLSKFNWIKINTVTNSSWIVSKISFLSWIASLLDSYFLNWNIWKKIMRSYTGNRTICWHEYPWILEILPVCMVQSYIACISKSPVKVREKSVYLSLQEQPRKDRATFKDHM